MVFGNGGGVGCAESFLCQTHFWFELSWVCDNDKIFPAGEEMDNSLKRIKDLERPAKEKRGTNTQAAKQSGWDIWSWSNMQKETQIFFHDVINCLGII